MGPARTGIEIPEGDPVREYTPEEEQRLTKNLEQLLSRVHQGEFNDRPLVRMLLQDIHAALFNGVRDHAGKCRSSSFGSDRLVFGPNRSSDRRTVPNELDAVLVRAERVAVELSRAPSAAGAIALAVKLHADVIRIHPFEDGNGRSSRALMGIVLVRLGFKPIPLEAPKQEYILCLNKYFSTGEIRALEDLFLQLYPTGN